MEDPNCRQQGELVEESEEEGPTSMYLDDGKPTSPFLGDIDERGNSKDDDDNMMLDGFLCDDHKKDQDDLDLDALLGDDCSEADDDNCGDNVDINRDENNEEADNADKSDGDESKTNENHGDKEILRITVQSDGHREISGSVNATATVDTDTDQSQKEEHNAIVELPKTKFETAAVSKEDASDKYSRQPEQNQTKPSNAIIEGESITKDVIDANQSRERTQNNIVETPEATSDESSPSPPVVEFEEDDDLDLDALLDSDHEADDADKVAGSNCKDANIIEEKNVIKSQSREEGRNNTLGTPRIESEETTMPSVLKEEKDDLDDLDLDALLDDDHEKELDDKTMANDGNEIIDGEKGASSSVVSVDNYDDSFPNDEDKKDSGKIHSRRNEKELPNDIASVSTEDEIALELDMLLDGEDNHIDSKEQEKAEINTEKNSDQNLAIPVTTEDKVALELDALLDGEHDEVEPSFQVIEEDSTIQMSSNLTQKAATTTGKIGNDIRRTLFQSPNKVSEAATLKRQEKIVREPERRATKKQSMGEILNRNSSSITASLSQSKKKIVSTRDKVRDYSRDLTKRASDRMKKDSSSMVTGIDQKFNLSSPRSFMSSTLSSARRFGGQVAEEVKQKKPKSLWGDNENMKGFRNYMRSTITFSNKVSETQNLEQQKAELKQVRAQKIVMNRVPWKNKERPTRITTSSHDDANRMVSPLPTPSCQRTSPVFSGTISSITKVAAAKLLRKQKAEEREAEIKKCVVDLSPRGESIETVSRFMNPNVDANRLHTPWRSQVRSPRSVASKTSSRMSAGVRYASASPAISFSDKSIGSVSSQCTVESFVSPRREGIRGCQNQFDPFLHEARGPCELCVFRLPQKEREKLDARGRHLLVQFTTGGCRDCAAFPKSVDEPHVRLCNKCHSVSHRVVDTRRRKVGNGTHIGYSFAKVSEGYSSIMQHQFDQ